MLLLALAILTALFSAGPQKEPSIQRIVAASNVRLRTAPQTDADVLSSLSLGAVLTQLAVSADGAWYEVLAMDGRSGWVFANLTQAFNDPESTEVYRRIIRS